MSIAFLLERFREAAGTEAIVWNDRGTTYRDLLERIEACGRTIEREGIPPGAVVALEADFSPNAVALFLALVHRGCIVVPLTRSVEALKPAFLEIAQCMVSVALDDRDQIAVRGLAGTASHAFYETLRAAGHPGLVLFSSGSTGQHKAAVHDLVPMLEKFKVRRQTVRAITFLLYDHIGGVNTMLYQLSNAGCLVTVRERTPDAVLAAVEKHRVALLPTTPTFINLILLSEAYRRHDLSHLKTVTYGTEPMSQSTLERFHAALPGVRLLQTYGLSEVGILRSKSRASDSLWVKVGGEGFQTRVVQGILQIKAQSAMLGYLNARSPVTEDGWFDTGDLVEVDGEWLRFLGRSSDIINVGGAKVYPAEVESVVREIDNVAEVVIYGEKNLITGSIVCADVRLSRPEDPKLFTERLKRHCAARLEPYKTPIKVRIETAELHSARFKTHRPGPAKTNGA